MAPFTKEDLGGPAKEMARRVAGACTALALANQSYLQGNINEAVLTTEISNAICPLLEFCFSTVSSSKQLSLLNTSSCIMMAVSFAAACTGSVDKGIEKIKALVEAISEVAEGDGLIAVEPPGPSSAPNRENN